MRSPLAAFHNAIYTRLSTNVSSATTYAFIPASATLPYIFIDRKQQRDGGGNKDRHRHRVRLKLLIYTDSDDVNSLQAIIDDVETELSGSKLTLADSWAEISRSDVPDVDIYPAVHLDGSQGHAAEIYYDYLLLDIS